MSKQSASAMLQQELEAVMQARRSAAADPGLQARRLALRRFQSERLARTHADLLAGTDTAAAARFFLEDLYGCQDLTERDANLARIVPTMERLLPETALRTVARAISLDALSERLDRVMAEALGTDFSEQDYTAAFRVLTPADERALQLAHVEAVGLSLSELVRVPMIGGTLRVMRGAAKLARLTELHEFLERGYGAFKNMREPEAFVRTIVARERSLLERIYAGADRLSGS